MAKKLHFIGQYIKENMLIKGVLLLALISLPLRGYALEVGNNSPDFHIVTSEGKTISYTRAMKAVKPVYLIFWATW